MFPTAGVEHGRLGRAKCMAADPEGTFDERELLHLLPSSRIAEARRFVCDTLVGWGASVGLIDDAALLTSELVGNALVHTDGPVTVAVSRQGAHVLVEVEDDSPEVPVMRPVDLTRTGGLGLRLVDSIAANWGVQARSAHGKTVWFGLPLDPAG